MSKNKFNNDIYNMYEKEYNNNILLSKEIKSLKLEITNLRYELDYLKNSTDNKIKNSVDKATSLLINENSLLQEQLDNALKEIDRLKNQINNSDDNKDYLIDKLQNQVNKNSTNSSIPTSKEIRTNKYNHRTSSDKATGGQINHRGSTLTKEKIEKRIKENNLEVRKITHYIDSEKYNNVIDKYRVGIEVKTYIEKHVFIPSKKSNDILPREFYSDVTYNGDLKMLIVSLGNYFSIPYNKIKELVYDLTNGIIDISEGTIDNIYEEFSNKTDDTLNNITNNILNGTYQHTDETNTKENGKDTYYRGYANKYNVIYKYHRKKGDKPIEEDGILTNYYGTIISDHDTGIFKYGTNNQDCIIHFGRYCIEKEQNIDNISWPMELYRLLQKFEVNRKILSKYGREKFTLDEVKIMEQEYDEILSRAKEEKKNTFFILERKNKYLTEQMYQI